jgi:hypothetical protein
MRWNYKDIVRWAVSRALVGSGEQGVLASQCDRAHRAFDGIGVELGTSIIEEQCQSVPMVQSVTNRLGQSGSAGEPGEQPGEPRMHRFDQRTGLLPARAQSFVGGPATDVRLDRVESGDPAQSLFGDRRLRGDLNVVKLPPCMRPTEGEFDRFTVTSNANEASIAVGLQQTPEAFQVARRMLALAVLAVNIRGSGMARAAPRPGIDRIAPEPSGLGLSATRIKHRQCRVVGEHMRRVQHRAQQQFVQRRQPPTGGADPVAERGTIQCHPGAGEDLGLAVERQVVAVFVDNDMREQSLGRHAAVDWTLGRGGLNHGFLTAAAAITRPADDADAQLSRDIIQHLGTIFADDVKRLATTRTGLVFNIDDGLDPGQMLRQRALVPLRRLRTVRCIRRRFLQSRRRGVQFG